jgi:hypothetical protein
MLYVRAAMLLLSAELDSNLGSWQAMIWQAVSAVSWWTPKSDVIVKVGRYSCGRERSSLLVG